jgi:hypothetical protein
VSTNHREARKHLLEALAALEDPTSYCTQHGYSVVEAYPCVVGAVRFLVRLALRDLGEPINPYQHLKPIPQVHGEYQNEQNPIEEKKTAVGSPETSREAV